jgi:hypothetical protein
VAIGLSQAQFTLRSLVGYIDTTSSLTSIPTLSRPFFLYLASGISNSTLLGDTLALLTLIPLRSPSSGHAGDSGLYIRRPYLGDIRSVLV